MISEATGGSDQYIPLSSAACKHPGLHQRWSVHLSNELLGLLAIV